MKRLINKGGINGTGKGIVNTNSKDYKALQKAIQEQAKQQTKAEQIRYWLIGLKVSHGIIKKVKPLNWFRIFL